MRDVIQMGKITRMVVKRERAERSERSHMTGQVRLAARDAAYRLTDMKWPDGFTGRVRIMDRRLTWRCVLTKVTCAGENLYLCENGDLCDYLGDRIYMPVYLDWVNQGIDHDAHMAKLQQIIIDLSEVGK